MKRQYLILLLYVLLVWATCYGREEFGVYYNPAVMLLAAIALAAEYARTMKMPLKAAPVPNSTGARLGWALFGLVTIAVQYEELRKLFVKFIPVRWSDVIPQLESQCRWFLNGELPYQDVVLETHTAYPVYMPAHWMPLALPIWLGLDVRWVGFLWMGLGTALGAWALSSVKMPVWKMVLVVALPSLASWGFIGFMGLDLAVSMETIIMAYYMVLCAGLLLRNNALITAGILLCLLSRYTLVFWLPVFMVLFWQNASKKQNLQLWGTVATGGLLLFVFPFLTKDPQIIAKALHYHNDGAVAAWHGFGEPPVSYTNEAGVFFGKHLKDILPGDDAHQVYLTRILQAGLMILINIWAFWVWPKWRNRMDWRDFALLVLYIVLMVFFFISPMTFVYYYLPFLGVAALMTGRAWAVASQPA